jgi:hypothetical protein
MLVGFSLGSIGQTKSAFDPTGSINYRYIKFYPNPATAVINFDLQKNTESSISLLIFNFMGKKIFELKSVPSHLNINLDNFYRGIYIYQLRNKNGQVLESGKFQVVK